uniref:DUF4880 domain-containing protein n=1 Tax=Phenylobacterium sp. TaxID=1871053 RepID=UPI00286B06D0
MAKATTEDHRADQEAADWFTRLNSRVVATSILEDFYAWRREPRNDEAYGRVEEVWRRTEALKGS